jgi:hypothetical protein
VTKDKQIFGEELLMLLKDDNATNSTGEDVKVELNKSKLTITIEDGIQ